MENIDKYKALIPHFKYSVKNMQGNDVVKNEFKDILEKSVSEITKIPSEKNEAMIKSVYDEIVKLSKDNLSNVEYVHLSNENQLHDYKNNLIDLYNSIEDLLYRKYDYFSCFSIGRSYYINSIFLGYTPYNTDDSEERIEKFDKYEIDARKIFFTLESEAKNYKKTFFYKCLLIGINETTNEDWKMRDDECLPVIKVKAEPVFKVQGKVSGGKMKKRTKKSNRKLRNARKSQRKQKKRKNQRKQRKQRKTRKN